MNFNKIFFIFTLFFALHSFSLSAQVCDLLIPICTSQDGLDNNAIDPSPLDIDTECTVILGTRTAWYYILIDEPTNFTFQIEPAGDVDYDFAVWLNTDCENLGIADRASYDAPGVGEYDTGLDLPSTDTCEGAAGDGDVIFMALVPGDEIIIAVDRFAETNDIFNLTFGDPDAFNCSIVLTEACDGDIETLDATVPDALGYTWAFENPIGSGNFDPFVPAETTESIDVTITGNYRVVTDLPGGVTDTNFFDVVFYPQPITENPPINLFVCDDGTSAGTFDFTLNTDLVLGVQNPLEFEVKYYETFADSDDDINEIPNPTTYTIMTPPTQTIFVRIQDLGSGNCYDLSDFIIEFSQVSIGLMTDVGFCDTDGSGQVDLDLPSIKNTQALGALDPLLYSVSYHSTQGDADNGDPVLPNPYTVTGPDEEIFVRVENNDTSTCFATGSFIVVITDPQIASPPEDLFQCDDGTNTGIFDFADNTDLVLGTQDPLSYSVSYHNTASDAETGALPIATPNAYPITGEIEEVFVRIAGESIVEDIIFLEDFGTGLGRVTHPYTNLDFNATTTLVANQYAVTNISTGLNAGWHIGMEDHTIGDTDGRMIFFDNPVPPADPEIYRRSIPVTANTDFVFDFFMTTLYDIDSNVCGGTGAPSNLTYRIEDAAGTVLATTTTGDVVNQSNPSWNNFSLNFNSGVNTEVQIVFINNITEACGGDFALDDIKIFKLENCFDTASFFIEFSPVSIGDMTDAPICDDDADGSVTINLPLLKDVEALGDLDPFLYSVTYYSSQGDADNGAPVLPNPYTITNPSEEFFVRVENNANPICFVTDSFEVFITSLLIALPPTPYVLCDEFPNDGLAEFDLTTKDLEITGGDPDAVLTYHLTFAEAESGADPILTPATFINTIANFQTIYPRLENVLNPDCYTTTELVLQVDQAPAITDPITDYFLCDDASGDGVEVFDLSSKNLEILNTQLGINLGYYSSQADAEAQPPTNIIIDPDAYTSAGEEIWVRADNSAGCVTVLSFNLVVGEIPSDFTVVPIFEQCDDLILDGVTEFDLNSQNPLITGGSTFLNVSYYVSQTDADSGIDPLAIPYTNITNPETIFVRVEDNTTGCHDTFVMDLLVIPPPDIFQPDPLEYCDPDNDGFGEFTLTDADSQVTGGIPLGNLQVSYHYLLEDAQNGVNPLASPYLNDVPFNQIVFVRLIDQTTGCYGTTTLELIVLDSPQIIQPSDLEQCDDDGDGVGEFDLTQSELELLNGLDPLLYGITYYEDAGLTIPILNPTGYVNIPPSPQTIHILVEDLANGCTSETILLLWVYTPPVLIAPLPYELCDAITPDDEQESFDLESRTAEITGGDLTISVTYYETQAQADTGDPLDALTSPYLNTANPQTIFLRAETNNGDNDLTCFVSLGFTLDLVVNPLPSPVTPTPLEVCDIDNDGLAEFTLTDKDDEIINGEPGVVVSYHETLFDAESGTLALASPYANIDTFSQLVYVRAEYPVVDGGTGCFRVITLELKTTPTPIIDIDLPALVECADDEFTVFNLTDQAALIYGTQDPLDYTLTYYTDPADAEAGVNAIANPSAFTNTSNPQTIWVRLDDNSTDCSKVGSFELEVELTPAFTVVPIFEQCDDQVQDGFTEFDLNTQNLTITGADPTLGVTYYATQDDADTGINPLVIPYTNITNPETVFVRIESVVTGCYGTFEMDLVVTALPDIFQPDPLEFCDPDNDGFGEFILSDADIQVTGGVPIGNLQVSYHFTIEDALNDENPLVSPYLNDVPFNQTVFVRLLDQTTGCFTTTTLDLVVLDSPQIIQPSDLELCDDNGDGIEVFDLTLSEDELLNGLDPLLYNITYYQDAGLTIPITNPTAYSNIPPSPQTIYILVEDIANECKSETTLLLWVYPVPVLITPLPYELCDAITPDDEQEPFDLESITEQITGGDININVTYYQTQAQADTGDPLDALTSPYLNTILIPKQYLSEVKTLIPFVLLA